MDLRLEHAICEILVRSQHVLLCRQRGWLVLLLRGCLCLQRHTCSPLQALHDLSFDYRYMMRGLVIDKRRGNMLKVDRHK